MNGDSKGQKSDAAALALHADLHAACLGHDSNVVVGALVPLLADVIWDIAVPGREKALSAEIHRLVVARLRTMGELPAPKSRRPGASRKRGPRTDPSPQLPLDAPSPAAPSEPEVVDGGCVVYRLPSRR